MIKATSFSKRFFAVGMIAAGLAFTSCNKEDFSSEQPDAAALVAYNLVPDQQAVNIFLSGNQIPSGPLAYQAYTGSYFNIYAGNRTVESFSNASTTPLDTVSYNFEKGKYYSLFVVGANNAYQNIISYDNYDTLSGSSGNAYVRYVNALSNTSASSVSVQAGGNPVVSTSAPFGTVSDFVTVTPGDVTVNASNEGISAISRTFPVEAQKIYTILITGLPNQTDSTKAPQIRYVLNGTATD